MVSYSVRIRGQLEAKSGHRKETRLEGNHGQSKVEKYCPKAINSSDPEGKESIFVLNNQFIGVLYPGNLCLSICLRLHVAGRKQRMNTRTSLPLLCVFLTFTIHLFAFKLLQNTSS